jgi:hypothetical protein
LKYYIINTNEKENFYWIKELNQWNFTCCDSDIPKGKKMKVFDKINGKESKKYKNSYFSNGINLLISI